MMKKGRPGFTMVELMMVIAILGLLTMVALPRIRNYRMSNNMMSAKAQVASSIATARAAAIQKGRTARFIVRGDRLNVEVSADTASSIGGSTATGTMIIISNIPLIDRYGVTIVPRATGDSAIRFDGRGFGSTGSGGRATFILTGGSRTDSVCVSSLGLIMKRGCGA
jgi:prepilin-type N-terminal cleavage/methylation domain-containing protein